MPRRPRELSRAIGIDDGHFEPKQPGSTKLILTLLRADNRLEGILSTEIQVDGNDSTEKILSALRNSQFPEQAECIFLDGINFAGFNVADAALLHETTKLPVIIVFRKHPGLESIRKALGKFPDSKERIALIEKAGKIHKTENILFQCHGLQEKEASALVDKFSLHSHLPEPVRIAHLIASAVTLGRSTTP